MDPKHQWKIERVIRDDDQITLKCQRDLRALPEADRVGKILLQNMEFKPSVPRDMAQLRQIGQATRQDPRLPDDTDPERWTGTEFVSHLTKNGLHLDRPENAGRYRLWIPEQALVLYDRVREHGEAEGLCTPGICLMGGGTILAAKWKHRTSTDIDIFWPRGRWTPKQEENAIRGWLTKVEKIPKIQRLSPEVNKIEWDDGDTDFIATNGLEENTARCTIAGVDIEACTTPEILAGKIYGRALIPYRDLFDAAVAELKEPGALTKALTKTTQMGVIGQESIKRIPGYCSRVMTDEKWKKDREKLIFEPACPEAWEYGPEIVRETVGSWLQMQRGRQTNTARRTFER